MQGDLCEGQRNQKICGHHQREREKERGRKTVDNTKQGEGRKKSKWEGDRRGGGRQKRRREGDWRREGEADKREGEKEQKENRKIKIYV